MPTILVIEDEPAIRENIIETLELLNYRLIGAENGLVGVSLARQHRPDLIICDVMMPELDGYGVLLDLRSDPDTATIPFIFLTAKADRPAMRQGMDMGADDYLTKPFTPSEIMDAVNARLERQAVLTEEHEREMRHLRRGLILSLPHEFRTPLTAILGYSEIILNSTEDLDMDQVLDMIGRINKSGLRLYRLLENYLIYWQLELLGLDEEGIQQLRTSSTSSPRAVIENSATTKAQQHNRQADLKLDVSDVEAVQIGTDSLMRIIGELTDNAFKFSQPGTPVYVGTATPGNEYVVQIGDRGLGMTPQQIASIEAFLQFERQLREQQGMGLGLIIAKRLVELYGGVLSIDSVPDQRTTIMIRLPLGN